MSRLEEILKQQETSLYEMYKRSEHVVKTQWLSGVTSSNGSYNSEPHVYDSFHFFFQTFPNILESVE